MTAKTLTIGELAKASATTPRTLRHFEAWGSSSHAGLQTADAFTRSRQSARWHAFFF